MGILSAALSQRYCLAGDGTGNLYFRTRMTGEAVLIPDGSAAQIGEEFRGKTVVVENANKCTISLDATGVDKLIFRDSSELVIKINHGLIESSVEFTNCQACELEISVPLQRVILNGTTRTSLHYHDGSYLQEIVSLGTKGTTVCLPDTCNMLPNSKTEKLLSTLGSDGSAINTGPLGA